jgi:hypothetical protein
MAARVLCAVYSMFGLGRDAIPHLVDDGERFDPGALSRKESEQQGSSAVCFDQQSRW